MSRYYTVESVKLEDYDGHRREINLAEILPLHMRTEHRPARIAENRWLDICRQLFHVEWVKIRMVTRPL